MPYSPTRAGIAEGFSRGADRIGRALSEAGQRRRFDERAAIEDERYREQQDRLQRLDAQAAEDRASNRNSQRATIGAALQEQGGGFGAAPGSDIRGPDLMTGIKPKLGMQALATEPPVGRLGLAPGRDERRPTPLGEYGSLPEPRLVPEPGPLSTKVDKVSGPLTIPEPTGPLSRAILETGARRRAATGGRQFQNVDTEFGPGYRETPDSVAHREAMTELRDRPIEAWERAEVPFDPATDPDAQRRKWEMDENQRRGFSPTGARLLVPEPSGSTRITAADLVQMGVDPAVAKVLEKDQVAARAEINRIRNPSADDVVLELLRGATGGGASGQPEKPGILNRLSTVFGRDEAAPAPLPGADTAGAGPAGATTPGAEIPQWFKDQHSSLVEQGAPADIAVAWREYQARQAPQP